MRQRTIDIYEFDELSDKAKATARDWWRKASEGDTSDFDYVLEDADRMAAILGIEIDRRTVKLYGGGTRQDPAIYWQLGYVQSDGVWIEAHYEYAKGAHRKIREEAPKDETLHDLADCLQALQKRYGYKLTARFKDDSRNALDLDLEHPTKEIAADDYKAFRDIVRDFEQWVYDQLRAQDEYLNSDDTIDENLRANAYGFTVDGKRCASVE